MDIKIEAKPHSSKKWRPAPADEFIMAVEVTRKTLEGTNAAEHEIRNYDINVALWNLQSGRIISTPFVSYRLAEGLECPRCHTKFMEETAALSRVDNSMLLCSDCGVMEAVGVFK